MADNLFSPGDFDAAALTAAINKAKFNPGTLARLDLFEESGIATTSAVIDYQDNALTLLPTSPRGGVAEVHRDVDRSAITVDPCHIPTRSFVMADSVQNKREFGTTSLDSVSAVLARRMAAMRANIELTIEHQAFGALKGQITDVDGSVLLDVYAAFGIAQQTLAMDLGSTSKLLLNTSIAAERMSEDALGGATPQSFVALCAPDFVDALRANPSYIADLRFQAPNDLFKDFRNGVTVGNVTYIECRSTPGLPRRIPAGEAYLVPVGIGGLLIRRYAPAPYMETVNTPGLPIYAKSEPMDMGKGMALEAVSCPMTLCTRPGAIIKLTKGA